MDSQAEGLEYLRKQLGWRIADCQERALERITSLEKEIVAARKALEGLGEWDGTPSRAQNVVSVLRGVTRELTCRVPKDQTDMIKEELAALRAATYLFSLPV